MADLNNLFQYIENGDVENIKKLMEQENLKIEDGKLVPCNSEEIEYKASYWDDYQLIKKIGLNSLYGAVTNVGSLFFDQRLGQSTTLSGRCTTRHMASKINEAIVGNYEIGDAIVYGDTDSSYFTVPNPQDYTKEQFIEYADKVAKIANESFPEFYKKTFNVEPERCKPIKCAREICATAGLFIKKKRYAAMVYDEKGFRKDIGGKLGKLKIMGLDIKRADCPEWVQDKLEETIKILLGENTSVDDIIEFIQDWRHEFSEFDPWKMGIPKRVNKLTYYNQMFLSKTKGVTIPGHVRASINWNSMLEQFYDRNSTRIGDGGKVIVCKLKKNKYNMDSIAYPIDQAFLPDWFKHLPFDTDDMIEVAIDQKVKNIFGILGWDLEVTKRPKQFSTLFTLE